MKPNFYEVTPEKKKILEKQNAELIRQIEETNYTEGETTVLATMKNVTIDEHNEELVNFAQTINFAELFKHTKAYMKVDCEFHQPEISTTRGTVHIRFESHDITSQTGAFAAILERCYLSSFSNYFYRDKETGEIGYWVTVSIQYEHAGGGSNGMDILTAWYKKSTGWTFKNAGK